MNKENLRIVFMGTPDFAVESLRQILTNGYQVVGVVTQPDKPVGRHGSVLQPPAVKVFAQEHNIPVLQPQKMKDPEFIEALKAWKPDVQVVVAFRMLPEMVWSLPPLGTFNVHAALLPQYRGAAPINWAVINGEKQTGVTTFFLDHDIDTGRIIFQRTFDIPEDADVEYVYNGLMILGAQLCVETLDEMVKTNGNLPSIPQEENATLHHAPKIFRDTCRINWQQEAIRIYNFVRGLSPYPGTWTLLHSGDKEEGVFKIYQTKLTQKPCNEAPGTVKIIDGQLCVACQDQWLCLVTVQPAGKKKMEAHQFANGRRDTDQIKLV